MRGKKIVSCAVILLSAGVFAAAVFMAIKALKEDKETEQQFLEMKKVLYMSPKNKLPDVMKQRNRDMVGYLEIPDTTISYPVMQTKENPDYYLTHNIDKENSFYGTPYLSAYCDLQRSDQLIVYGHNINGGKMFGALLQYGEENFYGNHKEIFLITDTKKRYEIFAVLRVNKRLFPYWKFVAAQDKAEYERFINQVKQHMLYETETMPEYGTQILTLSTCDNQGGKDARFLVLGALRK